MIDLPQSVKNSSFLDKFLSKKFILDFSKEFFILKSWKKMEIELYICPRCKLQHPQQIVQPTKNHPISEAVISSK